MDVPAQTLAAISEVVLLQERIELLTGKVIAIRANAPYLPTPTSTPLPPPPKPIVMAHQGGVNLRSGPSDEYFRVGRLAKGESLEIVGRNNDSSWWLVTTPGGSLAWLCSKVVSSYNVNNNIPVVTIPALLVQPNAGSGVAAASNAPGATPAAIGVQAPVVSSVAVPLPAGTPTAAASASRRFVQDTLGYKQLIRRLLLPTVSESFSPDGAQIAITEKIKLYTITTEGANSRVLLEDDGKLDLVGGAVWSPDGRYLAFVANRLQNCDPCGTVGLVRLSDGALTLFDPPPGLGLDLPRWTEDGRLLVNAHPGDPAQGTVYVYDTSGQGQVAAGNYLLSSSHDGQKWFPWQPGKTWQVGPAARADSYYGD
jgi:SH3-like domain-containing protein